jgi:hypothetical protein
VIVQRLDLGVELWDETLAQDVVAGGDLGEANKRETPKRTLGKSRREILKSKTNGKFWQQTFIS